MRWVRRGDEPAGRQTLQLGRARKWATVCGVRELVSGVLLLAVTQGNTHFDRLVRGTILAQTDAVVSPATSSALLRFTIEFPRTEKGNTGLTSRAWRPR